MILFGVLTFFGAIGIIVNGDIIAEVAYDVLTQFQWEAAFTGLGLESLLQFVQSLGWWLLVTFVAPNLGRLVPWWVIPAFVASWTPAAWAYRAAALAGTIAIGVWHLTQECMCA